MITHTPRVITHTPRVHFHSLVRIPYLFFPTRRQVLTIAHRISTIMHCDNVLVVHDGLLSEQGPPQELANKAGGHFAELVAASTTASSPAVA